MSIVPQIEDEIVLKLQKIIKSKFEPIYVPAIKDSDAVINECFPNVQKKVSDSGGDIIFGWQLWKGKFIGEAEFHAVWKSDEGELIDITPKETPIEHILFIQDDQTQYRNIQIDNIRVNLNTNVAVDDFINVHKSLFRIRNRGKRSKDYEIKLPSYEYEIYSTLQKISNTLLVFLNNGGEMDSDCFCNSGTSYVQCHRKEIKKVILASKTF
ncbi:hypothetical protein P5G61_05210 [Paenibacillus sp. F6_3S_P_1C]|uniref:SEC-C domain-containing protein n=1 Tax=Paenibacillus vandeheii TaxID=3035917 RepID=A0ABT8J8P6_9BACL|nr:hypothetical protein [Paenibacillus vandeheii]MDN4600614.1 hypothetical protein [Paenibacillus vandeheii]